MKFFSPAQAIVVIALVFSAGIFASFSKSPYQEVPVACESFQISGEVDLLNGTELRSVACSWGGEEQTFYECPEGIDIVETDTCVYVRCMKKRNIAVLLRIQH